MIVSVAEHVFCLEQLDDGTFRVVSGEDALVQVLGEPPAPGVEPAARWLEAIHPDDRAMVDAALEGACSGGTVDLEHRLVAAEDTTRAYRLRGSFRIEDGRRLFDAMVADITERRRAEHARQRAEQRYHAVVESLSEGLVVLGLDGRVVSANASAQRILGRAGRRAARSAAPTGSSSTRPAPRSRPSELPGAATLADGAPRTGEILGVHRPDGEDCWIEENTRALRGPGGELEGVVVTFADVTERFQAERRVRAERDFTARVLDTIADGVARDGRAARRRARDRARERPHLRDHRLPARRAARAPARRSRGGPTTATSSSRARSPAPAPPGGASTRRSSGGAPAIRSPRWSRSAPCTTPTPSGAAG